MVVERKVDIRPRSLRASSSCSRRYLFIHDRSAKELSIYSMLELYIYYSYFLHSGGALIPDFRCSL